MVQTSLSDSIIKSAHEPKYVPILPLF